MIRALTKVWCHAAGDRGIQQLSRVRARESHPVRSRVKHCAMKPGEGLWKTASAVITEAEYLLARNLSEWSLAYNSKTGWEQ